MIDRKKLIEQLETDAIATNTGYVEVPLFQFSDILALLKEQQEEIENLKQTAQSMMEGVCLLKEQEAVPVDVCGHISTVKYGHCPKCNEGLNSEVYPHWCGYCGQAVKWE